MAIVTTLISMFGISEGGYKAKNIKKNYSISVF